MIRCDQCIDTQKERGAYNSPKISQVKLDMMRS